MKTPGIAFSFGVIITLLIATVASACPLTGDCYSPVVAPPPVVLQQAVAPPVVVQSYAAPVRAVAVPAYSYGYGVSALGVGYGALAVRQNVLVRQGFRAGFSSFGGSVRIRQRGFGGTSVRVRIRR